MKLHMDGILRNIMNPTATGYFLVCLYCFETVGCGGSQLYCVPLKVEVTVDGKPFGPCAVRFERKTLKPGERTTVANLDKTGVGKCSTYKLNDGIPEGDYKVSLEPFGIGMLPIDRNYLDLKTSPLTAQVFKNSENIKFELEASKKKGAGSFGLPERLGAKSNQELLEESMPPVGR